MCLYMCHTYVRATSIFSTTVIFPEVCMWQEVLVTGSALPSTYKVCLLLVLSQLCVSGYIGCVDRLMILSLSRVPRPFDCKLQWWRRVVSIGVDKLKMLIRHFQILPTCYLAVICAVEPIYIGHH